MTRSGSYRSVLAALALGGLIAALAAAPPRVTPAPIATASPTPIPFATPDNTAPLFAPAVLVYPFEVGGDLKADAGLAVSNIFDQQLSTAGGLSVLPSPQNIKRADYLTNARALKADYYISGYLTPVGDGASIVMQLVSTQSGAMLFSRTAQVYTAQDASGLAFMARTAMFAHSGVTNQAQDTTGGDATPQPSATDGASVGLSSILNVFHHSKGASNSLGRPIAESAKPARRAIVARVIGSADANSLAEATNALEPALNHFFHASRASKPIDGGKNASAICGANRDATIINGTLAQSTSGGFLRKKTTSTFTLTVYTCFGAVLYTGDPQSDTSLQTAIQLGVAAYVKDHPDNS